MMRISNIEKEQSERQWWVETAVPFLMNSPLSRKSEQK